MLNLYSAHSYGRVCLSKATVDPLFLFHCRLKSSSQPGLGICSFAHRSNQMSDCERFAQIAQIKWANVSESLRLLISKEWPWANRSGRSLQMSHREQFAQVTHDKWANKRFAQNNLTITIFFGTFYLRFFI